MLLGNPSSPPSSAMMHGRKDMNSPQRCMTFEVADLVDVVPKTRHVPEIEPDDGFLLLNPKVVADRFVVRNVPIGLLRPKLLAERKDGCEKSCPTKPRTTAVVASTETPTKTEPVPVVTPLKPTKRRKTESSVGRQAGVPTENSMFIPIQDGPFDETHTRGGDNEGSGNAAGGLRRLPRILLQPKPLHRKRCVQEGEVLH
mmetsp:Transcript_19146/g.44603  ORF Transcript_19146/g.44603 Transcript_19146/m.44603 type:complete len:200 (+) Transcript_19146:143-742(+)